jgi:GNAT superfamily N-acetyltransferase
MASLRLLQPSDVEQALAVYHDAVISQATAFYNPGQIQAWAEHGRRGELVREALTRGHGLVSCASVAALGGQAPGEFEAFAVLDPLDRLSLLYCRGRSSRRGHGRTLVRALEDHARRVGCPRLRTEASQLSRPLLERLGWRVEAEETVRFAGATFERWRMIRDLS